jgi:protoheme IX farnesyltransferase
LMAAALGAVFIWFAWKALAAPDPGMKNAKALFAYSILYLFAIFALLLGDSIAQRAFSPA